METRDEDPITISMFWSILPFNSHRGKTRNILLSKKPQISGWRQSSYPQLFLTPWRTEEGKIARDQGDYLPGKEVEKVPLDGCEEKTRGEKTW